MIKIKLLPWHRYESKCRKKHPYEKFYNWLLPKIPKKKGYKISVSGIYLTSTDSKKLRKILYNYCRKVFKITKKHALTEVAWLDLDIGPNDLIEQLPEKVKSGYVYLLKKKLYIKE
jgi:hypothetical protein